MPSETRVSANSGRRPGNIVIVAVPILLVLISFLFWYQTWFGRQLTEREIEQYLTETAVPRKTQHALVQVADSIVRRDTTARRWYPLVLRLASNREAQLRLMAAWVMGQDDRCEEFHQALRGLLHDPEPMVRWNAALGLARFGDTIAAAQLRQMLRPYELDTSQPGKVRLRLKQGDPVRNGAVIARIETLRGAGSVDVRSPLEGRIDRWEVSDGAKVGAGEEIATLFASDQEVWEALRALYLVGQREDLADVERFASGVAGVSERVHQQAALTAQAIRQRTVTRQEGKKSEVGSQKSE